MSRTLKLGTIEFELVDGSALDLTGEVLVNAANEGMRGGGGFDKAVHLACGPKLLAALKATAPYGASTAQPVLTAAFDLVPKFNFICHVAGPRYWDGVRSDGSGTFDQKMADESNLKLKRTYYACLRAVHELKRKTIVFPSLSTGAFGFPVSKAAESALQSISLFAENHSGINSVFAATTIEKVSLAAYTPDEQAAYEEALDNL